MPNTAVLVRTTNTGLTVFVDFTKLDETSLDRLKPITQTNYALELRFNKGVDVSSWLIAAIFTRLSMQLPTKLTVREGSARTMSNIQTVLANIRKRQKAEVVANA